MGGDSGSRGGGGGYGGYGGGYDRYYGGPSIHNAETVMMMTSDMAIIDRH